MVNVKIEKFLDQKYQIIEDGKNGFERESVEHLFTDYFLDYDYIIGDWSYGKLRLKGFCDKTNPKYNTKNDINQKENYLKTYCAYQCRYFVLKKVVE